MNSESPMADRITAAVLLLLGGAMFWGGFVMDRLEIRQIHPASIPGLLPIFLGIILMICAVFLGLSTRGKASPTVSETPKDSENWSDFGFAAVWSCLFAIVMVNRIPFVVASAIYIAVFTGWYLWRPSGEGGNRFKMMLLVVLYAVLVAVGISALFRYGFLVRLP
ncbi:tripartite tricarboxylate transporter TctB family protein [Pararhizobium sp. IMCC21322]|uniref:tripartite tricarboxylate transporter TctB family protein n=1 Tax=Pararhizobium sp. IMCC21322 TaxID=3067903 RepID=UPI0027411B18|nr:tripartite tricarboxylate transporter TctB family protein [Pararhizobium sp. IMCC21322]